MFLERFAYRERFFLIKEKRMNKVKKFISVVLCIALLSGVGVQQVFAEGNISNVEQNEEVVLDDQNVKR